MAFGRASAVPIENMEAISFAGQLAGEKQILGAGQAPAAAATVASLTQSMTTGLGM